MFATGRLVNMANLVWPAIMIGTLLVIPAIIFARLLRSAGCPGWSVLGGLLAGLLMGSQILGALVPGPYEQHILGGTQQREALDHLRSRQGADVVAAKHTGVDPAEITQMESRHAAELESAQLALEAAHWDHQRVMRVLVMIIVGMVLIGSGLLGVAPRNLLSCLPAAISIGLWSATLPAALIIVSMLWWWDYLLGEALMVGAALAIGPWMLTPIDREAADQAEINGAFLIQTAGRIASTVAILLAGMGLFMLRDMASLPLLLPLLALPLGWLLPTIMPGVSMQKKVPGTFFDAVMIPSLAACVAFKADLFGEFAIWPVIVIMLLSDDGRWIAAFLGAMIPGGRRALRTMRLTLGSMAAGPTQLAVTAIGAHAGLIPASLVLPLMLGAALIEVTAPARRGIARRLAETEAELDDADVE